MKAGYGAEITAAVYQILMQHSDEKHLLSMPELQAYLSIQGIDADRRTVYNAIHALNAHDMDVQFVRKNGHQGYYAVHLLNPPEAFFLIDTIQQSLALSKTRSDRLVKKISALISKDGFHELPKTVPTPGKTNNDSVLKEIEILLPAASSVHPITFRYYDISPSYKKVYRINKVTKTNLYRGVPYAIFSNGGRFYCVVYIKEIQEMHTFRIDKMDTLTVSEEKEKSISFSLEEYIQNSFSAYTGKKQTIRAEIDNSLFSQLLDQFGKENLIITHINENTFQAGIVTADAPTTMSWFLEFYEHIRIIGPQSFINRFLKLADHIQNTYSKEKAK